MRRYSFLGVFVKRLNREFSFFMGSIARQLLLFIEYQRVQLKIGSFGLLLVLGKELQAVREYGKVSERSSKR